MKPSTSCPRTLEPNTLESQTITSKNLHSKAPNSKGLNSKVLRPRVLFSKVWPIALLLLLWEGLSLLSNHSVLLPPPLGVLRRFLELVPSSEFWLAVGFSMQRIVLGYLLALASAIALAALSHKHGWVKRLVCPLITMIRTVPVASFVILALLYVGSAKLSIVIAFLVVLPLVYANTLSALDGLDRGLGEMARVFELSSYRKLRYIVMPQMWKALEPALISTVGMAWKGGVAAEVIGIPDGSLGEKLYQAKIYFDTTELFAWTMGILLCSLFWEFLLKLLIRFLKLSSARLP